MPTNTIVSISEAAFFSIMTSALEAYEVRVDHDTNQVHKEHSPLETHCNLWGYEATTIRGESSMKILFAEADGSAVRTNNSVQPNPEAYKLKSTFVDVFFPEIEYLGDMHSHPYSEKEVPNELALQRDGYYEQSNGDVRYAQSLQEERNYRIQLIATIYSRKQPTKRSFGHLGDETSCIRFQYDGKTIWLKAYVYKNTGSSFRKVADKMVLLLCPSMGIHAAMDEI